MTGANPLRNRPVDDRAAAAYRLLDRIVDVQLDVGLHQQGRALAVAIDLCGTSLPHIVLDRGVFSLPVTIPLARVDSIRELTGPELTETAARLYPREDTAS
jgi:hypothetical protein